MTEELKLEDILGQISSEFTYIKTNLQEAVMDSSPEIRALAIRNLRDIGEHLPIRFQVIRGYEKYRKLYIRIKTNEGIQDIYVSEVPSKYGTESSINFSINGNH